MRWPQRSVRRALAVADGEAVWFWRPQAGVKSAPMPTRRADDGVNKASGPREERGRNRKTIAWGMPDVSGASAVKTGVHTQTTPQRTSGCGCIGHPAFPAPSVCERSDRFRQNLGRVAPRRNFACVSFAGMSMRGTTPSSRMFSFGLADPFRRSNDPTDPTNAPTQVAADSPVRS